MVGRRPYPDDVERDAWDGYRRAKEIWRKTKDGSPEEVAAIQAMSTAALAGYAAAAEAEATKRR